MTLPTGLRSSTIFILIFSIYAISNLSFGHAQTETWMRYNDPRQKFTFLHPPDWNVNSTHNDNGYTEVVLVNPNSGRMKATIMFIPNDPLLVSKTGKPIVPSRALTNFEEEISSGGDYFSFNSTGQFPHKYTIQGLESASDIIDYEKIQGRPGKMLIVYAKIGDKDSIVFSYGDSKRTFYKTLSNASQIIKSLSLLNR